MLTFTIVFLLPVVLCNEFKSVPTTVKTHENDTVLLPCYLDSLGTEETGGLPEFVRWYKDGELIANSANDTLKVKRIKLWDNGSLEVGFIQDSDTGEYTCEIVRKAPWSAIKQIHAIEVLYPPSIESNPISGKLQVQLGEEVQMSCSADGVPHPLMTWTSKGQELLLLDNRSVLKFLATDRNLSGIYECIASNGVGNPAKATIQLNVIYPPEVSSNKVWIHTAPGLRATLNCYVVADPPAEVRWFKSNISVPLDARVITLVDGEKHTLLIRNVHISDFGIYTCRATNELGVVETNIQLSGVANPVNFKKVEQKSIEGIKNSYTLVWEVDSYTSIIEYNLWFKPVWKKEWTKLTIPAEHSSGPMHSKAYTLTGLKENTEYEAMLFSRNRYGRSRPSKIYEFSVGLIEKKKEIIPPTEIIETIIPVEIIPVQMSSNLGSNNKLIVNILLIFICINLFVIR